MAPSLNDKNSIYEFVVRDGNGIKGLVDLGLSQVPDPYIQPEEERADKLEAATTFDYPPIDLSELDGPNHDQVVAQIVGAAETFGFFQVVNHGMPLELLETLKEAAHKFHGLPPEKKAAYLESVSPSPVVKYKSSFLPEKEKAWEWKDVLAMTYTNDADALAYWPKETKDPALQYLKQSTAVARKLLVALLGNLGVTLDDSKVESLMGFKSVIMNFYPPCPNPELTVGVGRHSDSTTLTVLVQDNIGGLYVKVEDVDGKSDAHWMEIPPIPGALVINAGDLLEVLSNGSYKSAEHKAYTTKAGFRVSIPCFIGPRLTEKIGPLPEAIEKDNGVARYREFVFAEYLKHYFSVAHVGKKVLHEFADLN